MKEDILDFKNEFTSSIESLKSSNDEKFNLVNEQFDNIRTDIKRNVAVIVADSLLEVKNSIIEALKAENLKLQQKVEKLENRISQVESDLNKKDQYNRRNNIEIQGIPSDISDDSLENKVIEMLVEAHIVATKSDIEDCRRLGNGSTIVRFVNRKFCNDILGKKFDLHKNIYKSKLSFANDTKIYVSENLNPYNQRLAWKCRELKRAKNIHKVWSMKDVIKIRRSPNERPYSIYNDDGIRYLSPDFIFKKSNTPK